MAQPKLAPTPQWLSERMLDISTFGFGLHLLEDPTKAPIGSARLMTNMMITDKGGISNRPGTTLLGAVNSNANGTHGFYNYVKSFGSQEIPVRAYSTELEYYHPSLNVWTRLMNGYTANQEFGFKESLVNTDNEDYLYFCNRTENYSRWSGATATTTVTLSGGETTVTVDSVLKTDIFESDTGGSWIDIHTATTLDDNSKNWAASQWVNFYIRITSGTYSGYIRKITANTATLLTFDTLPGDPGQCSYEIRMPKFPASGTLMLNGNQLAYTAIPTDSTFSTSAAVATPISSPVTVIPTTYPANPRGNRLELHYTRMIVGNVRSALSRDSSGNLQGSQSTGSYYASKTKNPTDFTFSANRVAGEGDIVSVPYGGGDITDIVNQEDQFYVFKKNYLEAVKYSQDTNDIAQRTQLKTGFGSINKAIKGKDDVYFVTGDNQLTSVGRARLKDTIPQHENIGLPIKALLDTLDFTATQGIEYKNRLFISCKASSSDTYNNRVLVYNQQTKSFEGLWELGAFGFILFGNNLHYADSRSPNVYQMFSGAKDTLGTDTYPISSKWLSNWMNLTPKRRMMPKSDFNEQFVDAIGVEGYIKGGTSITVELYKDFSDTAALSFNFGGTETQFLDSAPLAVFLGDNPLGLEPIGGFSKPDVNGNVHFSFIVYFPEIYSNHFSLGVLNAGKDQYFEITRIGLGLGQDTAITASRIKSL
jgi:hypothetical protein